MPTCDLVIPCRDEAAALPALLALVPSGLGVIVVDNGSVDGTGAVAAAHGARVVREDRPGYGAAVHAGVEASDADLVAVLDGDGSMDPRDLPRMIAAVADGATDLACGRRRPTARGLWPWHARGGNAVVLWWLRRPKVRTMRVPLMGVVKRLQATRLASQLAFMMIEYIRREAVTKYGATRGEIGWILEDNQGMVSIAEMLGSEINRTYRLYGKAL